MNRYRAGLEDATALSDLHAGHRVAREQCCDGVPAFVGGDRAPQAGHDRHCERQRPEGAVVESSETDDDDD
jgi:hypothetical protein